jgi:hypothetical protein
MKKIIYLLCLVLMSNLGKAQNVFTKIPTPEHRNEVDIYFLHELPIKEPYFKTLMIEVEGTNYNDCIVKLKKEAQNLGADGVIILQKDGAYLAGIGIKYSKNLTEGIIDSLNVVKKIKIIPINDKRMSGDINFDIDGSIKNGQSPELIQYFVDNVLDYDFGFLVKDKSSRWRENYDLYGRLSKRKLYVSDMKSSKKITFSYETPESKRPIFLTLDNTTTYPIHSEKLVPIDNEKNQWAELQVFWKDTIVKRQRLFYDTKDRLIMADWTKFEGGQEKPFLRVEYEYFEGKDIKQ